MGIEDLEQNIIYCYRLIGVKDRENVVKIGTVTTRRKIKNRYDNNEIRELVQKMVLEGNIDEKNDLLDSYCRDAIKKRVGDQTNCASLNVSDNVEVLFGFIAMGMDKDGVPYVLNDNDVRNALIKESNGNIIHCHDDKFRFHFSGKEWVGLTSDALNEGKDYHYIINKVNEIAFENKFKIVQQCEKFITKELGYWILRPEQEECVNYIIEYFKETGVRYNHACSVVISALCRFGKTFTALSFVKKWNDDPEIKEEDKFRAILVTSSATPAIKEWGDTYEKAELDKDPRYVKIQLGGKNTYKDDENKFWEAYNAGKYVIVLSTAQNIATSGLDNKNDSELDIEIN